MAAAKRTRRTLSIVTWLIGRRPPLEVSFGRHLAGTCPLFSASTQHPAPVKPSCPAPEFNAAHWHCCRYLVRGCVGMDEWVPGSWMEVEFQRFPASDTCSITLEMLPAQLADLGLPSVGLHCGVRRQDAWRIRHASSAPRPTCSDRSTHKVSSAQAKDMARVGGQSAAQGGVAGRHWSTSR